MMVRLLTGSLFSSTLVPVLGLSTAETLGRINARNATDERKVSHFPFFTFFQYVTVRFLLLILVYAFNEGCSTLHLNGYVCLLGHDRVSRSTSLLPLLSGQS